MKVAESNKDEFFKTLIISPGDTVVFHIDTSKIDQEDMESMHEYIRSSMPKGTEFIIVDDSVKVTLLRKKENS